MSGFLCPHCATIRRINNVWNDDGGYDDKYDHCWYCGTLVDTPAKHIDLAAYENGDLIIEAWPA